MNSIWSEKGRQNTLTDTHSQMFIQIRSHAHSSSHSQFKKEKQKKVNETNKTVVNTEPASHSSLSIANIAHCSFVLSKFISLEIECVRTRVCECTNFLFIPCMFTLASSVAVVSFRYWIKFADFFFVCAKWSAQLKLMKSKSNKKRVLECSSAVCFQQFFFQIATDVNTYVYKILYWVCVCVSERVHCTSNKWAADDDLLNCEIAIYKLDMSVCLCMPQ